jgi:hypothetical protein
LACLWDFYKTGDWQRRLLEMVIKRGGGPAIILGYAVFKVGGGFNS